MTDETRDLDAHELYINRELSWLEFNHRVLLEGCNPDLPLLERLKFLAIVSSNLDEFFMIRVAGLKQQREAKIRRRDVSGMTPTQQLAAIAERTHRMTDRHGKALGEVLEALGERGVRIARPDELTADQKQFASSFFQGEVAPVLTPLSMDEPDAAPALPGCRLMLALRLSSNGDGKGESVSVVPIPTGLPRFVAAPADEGLVMIPLEEIIGAHVESILPGTSVEASTVFRITRDADVAIEDDAAADLLKQVEKAVRSRRRRGVVRLEIAARVDRSLRRWLVNWAGVGTDDVYEIDGLLDASALMDVATRPGLEELKIADWPAQPPRDLVGEEDLWTAIREGDRLMIHPYESFEPVVQLIQQAAVDPDVLAIKQTLYRTSGDSPIIRALEQAAQEGKQVIVLVELKARFDESRNVTWARRLEDAGAFVVYGIAGYKTHGKALLIVRREAHRIRRYVHLSTGNYNDKTAKLYSDMGMFTADPQVAADVAAFFNLLTGFSEAVGWQSLSIAPTAMRKRFCELIDREIRSSTPDRPGLILAKVNSLSDKGICQALYRASQAGVTVRLNVRGICCLRPGVDGVSENIHVVSIVDRFLEHARIFYFRNGGHEEVYLSSADWMTRNLDKRLEILFPVTARRPRARIINALKTYLADNVKAHRLGPDGEYRRVRPASGEPSVRAQEALYQEAIDSASVRDKAPTRFRPMTRPEE
jgi:polyphosphate kinase